MINDKKELAINYLKELATVCYNTDPEHVAGYIEGIIHSYRYPEISAETFFVIVDAYSIASDECILSDDYSELGTKIWEQIELSLLKKKG